MKTTTNTKTARVAQLVSSRTTDDLKDMARTMANDARDASGLVFGWILDELCERSEKPGSGITSDEFVTFCDAL